MYLLPRPGVDGVLDSLALLMLTLHFSPRVAGGDGPSTCTGCLQMTQATETSIVKIKLKSM